MRGEEGFGDMRVCGMAGWIEDGGFGRCECEISGFYRGFN